MKLDAKISMAAGHNKTGYRLIKKMAEVAAFGKGLQTAIPAQLARPAHPGMHQGVGRKSSAAIGEQAVAGNRNPDLQGGWSGLHT